MTKTPKPLPPGEYTVFIDRIRKVRNKNLLRMHMTIKETGEKITETIKAG